MRTIRVGPTAPLRDALTAFRDTWPGLALGVYDGSTASYKEGTEAYRLDPDEPITTSPDRPTVELTGDQTEDEVSRVLYRAFAVDAQVWGTDPRETLDDAAARLAMAGLAAHDPDPAARPLPPLDPA